MANSDKVPAGKGPYLWGGKHYNAGDTIPDDFPREAFDKPNPVASLPAGTSGSGFELPEDNSFVDTAGTATADHDAGKAAESEASERLSAKRPKVGRVQAEDKDGGVGTAAEPSARKRTSRAPARPRVTKGR